MLSSDIMYQISRKIITSAKNTFYDGSTEVMMVLMATYN